MKFLKILLVAFLATVVAWLVLAAFIDGKTQFEKSISINASPEKVWSHTNSLKAMDQWSPWNKLDPHMTKEWQGVTGKPGEKNCWDGNETAGKGCLELVSVDSLNRKINTEMVFLTPYESESTSYVQVDPEGNGARATWTFGTEVPYPWTVTTLVYDLEKMIGRDYEEGLENLKKIAEQEEL